MALNMDNFVETFMQTIKRCVASVVTKEQKWKDKTLKVVKRNKCLRHGDFLVIPSVLPKSSDNSSACGASEEEQPSKYQNSSREDEDGCSFISRSNVLPNGHIILQINQKMVTSHVISNIESSGDLYGCMLEADGAFVAVNCAFMNDIQEMTLDHLRGLVLAEHVGQLLKANGFNVNYIEYEIPQDTLKTCQSIGLKFAELWNTDSQPNSMSSTFDLLKEAAQNVTFLTREETDVATDKKHMINTDGLVENDGPTFTANLREFLRKQKLETGQEGFDKNIHMCTVSRECNLLKQTDKVYRCIREKLSQSQTFPPVCIHVDSYRHELVLQRADLCLKMLTSCSPNFQQNHLIYGPVECNQTLSAKTYCKMRLDQMWQASVMKYGQLVQGEGWDQTIHSLTQAAVKFDMLANICRQKTSIDEVKNKMCSDYRGGGVFVMYNCARLATLLKNFNSAVNSGTYPPLPPLTDVDLSLLKNEEEWALVYNYLLVYPDVVQESVKAAIRTGRPRTPFNTHKISQFLQELSRDFSSYYSRTHILTEPRSHLLPVMYARLYLIRALQQVMHNALALLCIHPLNQL